MPVRRNHKATKRLRIRTPVRRNRTMKPFRTAKRLHSRMPVRRNHKATKRLRIRTPARNPYRNRYHSTCRHRRNT